MYLRIVRFGPIVFPNSGFECQALHDHPCQAQCSLRGRGVDVSPGISSKKGRVLTSIFLFSDFASRATAGCRGERSGGRRRSRAVSYGVAIPIAKKVAGAIPSLNHAAFLALVLSMLPAPMRVSKSAAM